MPKNTRLQKGKIVTVEVLAPMPVIFSYRDIRNIRWDVFKLTKKFHPAFIPNRKARIDVIGI
jgi:hypothetical protein